jgi:hypothetical protein
MSFAMVSNTLGYYEEVDNLTGLFLFQVTHHGRTLRPAAIQGLPGQTFGAGQAV